ncbi:hypothetical protein ABPG74_020212 [Tetrahymena malaccensis]
MRKFSAFIILILAFSKYTFSCTDFASSFKTCTYTYCQQDLQCYDIALAQLSCAIKQCSDLKGQQWSNCFSSTFTSTCNTNYLKASDARNYCLQTYDFSKDCANHSNHNVFIYGIMLSLILLLI